MALGDGIRRNIATVTKAERNRLRDAVLALQSKLYPGGVSYWFKPLDHNAKRVEPFPLRRHVAPVPEIRCQRSSDQIGENLTKRVDFSVKW
jgi:hypothetical protein